VDLIDSISIYASKTPTSAKPSITEKKDPAQGPGLLANRKKLSDGDGDDDDDDDDGTRHEQEPPTQPERRTQ
jgi:hypothetical protein